jgi:hypothetical protein
MRRARLLSLVVLMFVPAAAWPQGNPVGPEFRVNSYTTNTQGYPSVAAVPSGGFVVVWQSAYQDGSNYGVFGQRYDGSGAALGAEFRVNAYTTGHQRSASVAVDGSGNFVVVWTGVGQYGGGVIGQRYASAGAPLGLEFRVNTYTGGVLADPAAAADGLGNFVVVWSRGAPGGGGPSNIVGQRYASSGVPLGTEFLVNTSTTSPVRRPAVASAPSGIFVVVWESFDGSSIGVAGQRYASSGAPLGTEFQVNTYTTDGQYRPAVSSDASGGFVVVWESLDGYFLGISGQRFAAAGAPAGPEFRVNTYTTIDQTAPSVAADASGNFVVAWESNYQDGSARGIYAQRYDSSGVRSGPEFRVNTFTPNNQFVPAVAADASGNFLVVWESPQDGFNGGVFGQRYGQIVPVELMHFRVE